MSVNGGSVTLYAVWEANSYIITLNAAGGSNSGSVGATYDSVLTDIATLPARYGYNFVGYFDAETGGVQYFGADGKAFENKTFTCDDNIVLYAQWSPVTYTIELYSEGKYLYVIENVVFGELFLPSAQKLSLTRENFDFVGWNMYDEQNWAMYRSDTLYSIGLTGKQGEIVVLYAAWQEKPIHSLFYDANGGAGAPATTQAHEDETIVLSDIVPLRENYTFVGWSITADSQSAQFYPGQEFTMGSAVVTLYALWKHNPSLSYDANNGTFVVSVESSYPAEGETVVVISLVPQRDGYVFAGWSNDQYAVEALYHSGDEFIMPDVDTVLYAVWNKAQYTVTADVADGYEIAGLNEQYYFEDTASFSVTGTLPKVYINGQLATAEENGIYSFTVYSDMYVFVADGSKLSLIYSANGGSGAPSDNTAYNDGDTATISSAVPQRLGYTFIGWSTNKYAESEQDIVQDTVVFAGGDIVLYAVWQGNDYTVTYDPNGGTGDIYSDVFTYGTVGLLSLNAFEKTGHTFVGWALSENGAVVYGDGAKISDLSTENNGNITLYAVWEQTVTVITFNSDTGSQVNDPIAVAYGEHLSSDGVVSPVRTGYRFAGYFTQSDGEGEMIFDAELNVTVVGYWDKNVKVLTLYPYWLPVTYTVVYINGQEIVAEQAAIYGTTFSLYSVESLAITSPDGSHFAGWSSIPSGQIAAYTDGQTISTALTQTDGDRVYLYAVFEANETFAVTYHANGGSGAPVDNNKYFAGETVFLSEILPEREGYIFGGWSFDPNADLVNFPFVDGNFTTDSYSMPDGGMSLYAVWVADETLQSQIDGLKGQAVSLAEAITALQNADSEYSVQLEQLGTEMKSAQDAIAMLDDTYATDESLATAVNELKELLTQAETNLEEKISQVQANLDSAVAELNTSIESNKADIEEKLAAVDSAYKAADILINSSIAELQTEDGRLAQSIAELDRAYKVADTELQQAIDTVQANLDTAVAELNTSIESNKADIEEKLAAVDSAYKAADILINSSIAELQTEDGRLAQSIAELDRAYKAADTELQQAIDTVQANLDSAVAELNTSIESNKADIEEKLAAVDSAYKAADILINSSIAELQTEDGRLAQSIAELDRVYKAADTELQQAIDTVQANLDSAVAELNTSIESNEADIEEKLAAVDSAYKAADILINSSIAELQTEDGRLAQSIAALETAYKAADEAIWAGINRVQENLNALIADNEKTSSIYMIVNIVLGVVAVVLMGALVVRSVKNKNSQE